MICTVKWLFIYQKWNYFSWLLSMASLTLIIFEYFSDLQKMFSGLKRFEKMLYKLNKLFKSQLNPRFWRRRQAYYLGIYLHTIIHWKLYLFLSYFHIEKIDVILEHTCRKWLELCRVTYFYIFNRIFYLLILFFIW